MLKLCRRVADQLVRLIATLLLGASCCAAAADLPIYTDGLPAGWDDWSWNVTPDFSNPSPTHSGSASIRATIDAGWGGVYMHADSPVSTASYDQLQFWVHGGTTGGHQLRLVFSEDTEHTYAFTTSANNWTQITIPLSALGNPTLMSRLTWQGTSNDPQPVFYIDDVSLVQAAPTPPTPTTDLAIYADDLATGWVDYSWYSDRNYATTSPVHAGAKSLAVTVTAGWGALYLHANTPINSTGYGQLQFWIHGGSTGNQSLLVSANGTTPNVPVSAQANTWVQVNIPLSALGSPATVTDLYWFDPTGAAQPTFYLDDIVLVANTETPTYLLAVTKAGAGSGTVSSSPAGISCGATCSASFASGTSVTLSATPAAGSIFTGWSGACNGSGSCNVSMSAAQSVGANFAAAGYSDNGDGTVTDSGTGLVWMRCAIGQAWSGSSCDGSASSHTWDQANAITGTVAFAGQSDWRLPNIRELTLLADRSRYNPAIDVNAFPNTPNALFWSASSFSGGLGVHFLYGVTFDTVKSTPAQVRLVRAGQSSASLLNPARPTTDYVDHGDGTASHTPTGLMWQRCAKGQTWAGGTCTSSASDYTWDQAYALTDTFANHSDWRLPTIAELESLIDYTLASPSAPLVNATIFPATSTSYFWSASTVAGSSDYAWDISMLLGDTGYYVKTHTEKIRLVRGGNFVGSSSTLDVTFSGTGSGSVTSSPAGVNCTSSCSASFTTGTSVTLTASAASGSSFSGWGGACSNSSGSCTVSMTASRSVTASFALNAPSSHLVNLSTRGRVQTGDNVMIGGFILQGSTPKTVLIRAVGPTLANSGVSGVLANPKLDLYSGQTVIASNDNWQTASNAAAVTATGLAPANSLESAILTNLNPGAYTAIVSGVSSGTGVAIVEVYEIDQPENPVINISTRGQVQTGDNVMIGGFIIQGSASQTVLIRAVGPNLANYGVPGVLANPKLDLYSGQTVIASNDNWQSAANAAAISASGLAPVNPLESAILITLQPGAYTAIVSGSDGGSGVGMVEVFAQ